MKPSTPLQPAAVEAETRAWVERVVIGLNLCPFAKAVQARNQIRYVVCAARDEATLLVTLLDELKALTLADPQCVATTLLIHPCVLSDFLDFNQFLEVADETITRSGFEGVVQLASFHPNYRFAGTATDDVSNATNRSPYPMLHLLREASVERAVAAFPDAATIYETNIQTLRELGAPRWRALLRQCAADAHYANGLVSTQAATATRGSSKASSSRLR